MRGEGGREARPSPFLMKEEYEPSHGVKDSCLGGKLRK